MGTLLLWCREIRCSTSPTEMWLSPAPTRRRRMTLTYPVINRARRILWLVTGSEKVGMLARLRKRDVSIPAGRIQQDRAFLFADRAAAPDLAAEGIKQVSSRHKFIQCERTKEKNNAIRYSGKRKFRRHRALLRRPWFGSTCCPDPRIPLKRCVLGEASTRSPGSGLQGHYL